MVRLALWACGLCVLAACAEFRPPLDPVLAAGVDAALVEKMLLAQRRNYRKNAAIVAKCEHVSVKRCAAPCEVIEDWDEHSGTTICAAPEAISWAWFQESQRRKCDRGEDSFWIVYGSQPGKFYAECHCPQVSLAAFIADGYVGFDDEKEVCISERRDCERRGGKFHSPELVAIDDHPLIAAQPVSEACILSSHSRGENLWVHQQLEGGRCVRAVLKGVVEPPDVNRLHWCE